MKLKRSVASAVLVGATVFSSAAFAGASGSVGAFSEYMWRGLPQTGGAAVQGSLNYAFDSGLYVGTWVSNLGYGGSSWPGVGKTSGTEQDVYGGFAGSAGDFKYDLGVVYEWVPEENEDNTNWSTLEIYGKVGYGPVLISYFYSPEQNFVQGASKDYEGDSSSYITGTVTLPMTEKLSFVGTLSYFTGKEIEKFMDNIGESGNGYMDYAVGVTAAIDGGYTAGFSYIGTDISAPGPNPKLVVSLTKAFEL